MNRDILVELRYNVMIQDFMKFAEDKPYKHVKMNEITLRRFVHQLAIKNKWSENPNSISEEKAVNSIMHGAVCIAYGIHIRYDANVKDYYMEIMQ